MEKDFVALLLLGFLSFRFSTFILKNISDFLKSKNTGCIFKKREGFNFYKRLFHRCRHIIKNPCSSSAVRIFK